MGGSTSARGVGRRRRDDVRVWDLVEEWVAMGFAICALPFPLRSCYPGCELTLRLPNSLRDLLPAARSNCQLVPTSHGHIRMACCERAGAHST